jgi:glyoxylase-like metal-dependent hydrolase (beta-lactamase superfamily II)
MGDPRDEHLCWQIGDVTVTRVEERVTAVPHGSIISELPSDLVDGQRPWVDPFVTGDARIVLSTHCFVLASGGTTVVVDTCVGDHGERPLPGDPTFGDRLDAAIDGGLAAVDVVLCTHLHFDHVGWNTRHDPDADALVPTFPNARYLVTAAELSALAADDHHDIGPTSIEPLRALDRLDVVSPDHRLTPEVRLVPTPGHTPGHVSVLVESGGERAVITGDVAHSPIQFVHPDLTADRFDDDPALATVTRRRLIADVADGTTLVLGTHFPPPTAGRIRRTSTGTTFEPLT